jgi:hypothetical protein
MQEGGKLSSNPAMQGSAQFAQHGEVASTIERGKETAELMSEIAPLVTNIF